MKQRARTSQMIYSVSEIVSFASQWLTLFPGDVILTGTPSGVAATVAGDKLECEIEGVGHLTVTIALPAA